MIKDAGEFYEKLFRGWYVKFRCRACGQFTTRRDISAYDVIRKSQRFCSVACSNKGTANGLAKLTKQEVLEIRDLANAGVSQKEIADQYGTTQSNVSRIKTGKRWQWMDNKGRHRRA